MKLCLICSEYPPYPHGGIGTFTRVLARGLVEAGHQVRVAGMYPHGARALAEEDDQGVDVRRLFAPRSRYAWPVARWQLWKQVAAWAREGAIDLVEAPDWEGITGFWPRLPVPVVIRVHGSVSYFQRELGRSVQRSIYNLERSAFQRADAWCSVSRYTAERTREVFGLVRGPDAILYNPVETSEEVRDSSRQNGRVVFSGTLTYKKGIVSLVRAWPAVLAACPSAELHVFGKDGRTDDRQSMLEYLKGLLPDGSQVQFHGHVTRERLFEALETARVAVFPSYAEAFAVAPLEAMTQGCPTIASCRGSGPELIEHGVDGLLVDPDQPEDIARQIVRVLQDDALAIQLSTAGRQRVQQAFCLRKLLQENLDFYQATLERFAERRRRRTSPSLSRV
ncbi:MAG: glycosyltransferase family 4 protein [Aureliella sp.]